MYFKKISMKSYGPIDNLSYTFREDKDGNPIPLIIIGRNGCGKTLLFSNIVDMLVETKRKIYPSGILEVSDNNYYKIGNKSYIKHSANTSIVEIEFGDKKNSSKYKDIMSRDPEKAIKENEITYSNAINSQKFKDNGFFKEVTVNGFTGNNFDKSVQLFFPFDRFYKPMWYNPENYNRVLFDGGNNVGYSKTNLVKIDILENITDWFRNVYLCSNLINITLPNDKKLPPNLIGQTITVPQDTKLQQELKNIFSVIKGDGSYTTKNIKRNQKGIGLNGPSLNCNDISQLSAGELVLYSLALSIVKEWDIVHNNDNLDLSTITGCVLIDEADANLHIDFAYRALPALMKLFPKVQFILSTHSPFLLAGLKKVYGKDIDIISLPDGNLIEDLSAFSEVTTAYNVFNSETSNLLQQLTMLKKENERISGLNNKIIIYTEGKTDVKYLKLAFEKLDGYEDISSRIEYYDIEHAKSTGDGELSKIYDYLQKGNDSNIKLCMFDRDNEKYIFSEPFIRGNNNVYKFNLVTPLHHSETDLISVEHCLSDDALKTTDENGRRIFLSGEFASTGISIDNNFFCRHNMGDNPLEILDGSKSKKVYKTDSQDETNYALTKDDFVQHIIDKDPGFDDFSFEGFRPTLDLIKDIIRDVEGIPTEG